MKKHLIILLAIFSLLGAQAQDVEEKVAVEERVEKKNHFYFSIELLKTIPWLMIDNAYIIEPQIEYRSKGLVLLGQFGINSIKNTIYDDLAYKNEGMYFKVGAAVDFSYYNNKVDRNNVLLGGNLVFSSFDETGTIDLENNYFDDPVLTQRNESRGIEIYFAYRRVFDNNFFMTISPRMAYVMTNYEEPYFPVYYNPGFGVVNIFEGVNGNHRLTVGASIKIGYRF